MGLLPDILKWGLRMRRECRERFSPPSRVSDPDMHHGTCATHVPWCMPGSSTSDFLWNRQRGKRSRHSRRMRNLQFYVSGKRPILAQMHVGQTWNPLHYLKPYMCNMVERLCINLQPYISSPHWQKQQNQMNMQTQGPFGAILTNLLNYRPCGGYFSIQF